MNRDNEYKEIDYFGTSVKVNKKGQVIWNDKHRNIYYNADGYAVCSINVPNKGWRSVSVARLVALAYIPNPYNLPEVNHKDYNRANPFVENLEWVSRKDNVNYSKCNKPDYSGANNPNYGNKKLSQRYAIDKEYANQKQSRKGLKNGRCRKIKMFRDGELLYEFDYIVQCCQFMKENYCPNTKRLDSIRSQIDKSIRLNKNFKGFVFVKE